MATICPYCNIEVSESAIEAEDGCCPECGSVISASSSFLGEEPSEYGDDIEKDDLYDEFDDDDDIFGRDEFDDDEAYDEDDELDDDFDNEEFDGENDEEF